MSESPTIAPATSSLRFSIRSLLILVTVVCVLLAPYPWLGGGYLFALVCSILLIALSVQTYRTAGIGLPILMSILSAVIGVIIAIGSLALLLCSIANLIGCIVCAPFKVVPRRLAVVLCLFGLAPYVLMLNIGSGIRQRSRELLANYPVQSLEERLNFENGKVLAQELTLHSKPEAQLTDFETRNDRYLWRTTSLKRLHNETYQRFTIAAGFGSLRMAEVSDYALDTRPRSILSVPLNLESKKSSQTLPSYFGSIHESALYDFFDGDRLGYAEAFRQVVGFEPHGPTQLDNEISAENPGDESNWQLTRLELVSLLKHDEPRVYIAETIPLMNELDSLPHRSLNEFEAQALPQLATEKDTVIDEFAGGAKMLGAVRAGNDCLQCHTGPRGKLLGAFSYEFRLVK